MDYIDIGPTPCEESAAQVGDPDYSTKAYKECGPFVGSRPQTKCVSIDVVIRSHRYDFGTYNEAAVRYDDTNLQATDYAYMVENQTPAHWDAQAEEDLK